GSSVPRSSHCSAHAQENPHSRRVDSNATLSADVVDFLTTQLRRDDSERHHTVGNEGYLGRTVSDGFVDSGPRHSSVGLHPSNPPLRNRPLSAIFHPSESRPYANAERLDARRPRRIVGAGLGDDKEDVVSRNDQQPPIDPVVWWR